MAMKVCIVTVSTNATDNQQYDQRAGDARAPDWESLYSHLNKLSDSLVQPSYPNVHKRNLILRVSIAAEISTKKVPICLQMRGYDSQYVGLPDSGLGWH